MARARSKSFQAVSESDDDESPPRPTGPRPSVQSFAPRTRLVAAPAAPPPPAADDGEEESDLEWPREYLLLFAAALPGVGWVKTMLVWFAVLRANPACRDR